MTTHRIISAFIIVFFSQLIFGQKIIKAPPVAKVNNIVDEYFGVKVDDPYRYMENLNNAEVQKWIKGQADFAAEVLQNIPGRDVLFNRLKELDGGKPFRISGIKRSIDGTLFYKKLAAGENISKLYMNTPIDKIEKLLIDPEVMNVKGEQHYSLESYNPSPDGRFIVYGLAQGGSERVILHVLDIMNGKELIDTIDNIETAYNIPRWFPDGSGFFYCRRQELPPNAPETEIYKKTKTYFHKLNTDSKNDILIMGFEHSPRMQLAEIDFPSIFIPANSDYALAKIKHGDANELVLYTAPINTLLKSQIPWVKICSFEDEVNSYAIHENDIYLMTAKEAPRFKVVRTSLKKPDFSRAQDVIEESDLVVQSIYAAQDALYAGILDGGFNRIVRLGYEKDAKPEILELPDDMAGYITSYSQELKGILVYATAWTKGSLIYDYNPDTGEFNDSYLMPRGKYDDIKGFTSKQVKVKSHDGVLVPLSIIFKNDIELDGSNPTLINGYGSYGFSRSVYFNPLRIAWLEQGGVLAVAHVRGGGEYGKAWHHAGQKLTKPNTWKDFIACTEYLINEGYTSRTLIAGEGGSAGGILIGRAITEKPDLYAAAIIAVGSLDAIRFETTTNGVPNIPEFGTVENEDGFKGLYEMSSYHHVKDGEKYPAVLLTHGINDPRVNPWMSAKMTARLQAASSSGKPILFRVDYEAGHGIGSTRNQYLENLTDKWAFLFWQFGIEVKHHENL